MNSIQKTHALLKIAQSYYYGYDGSPAPRYWGQNREDYEEDQKDNDFNGYGEIKWKDDQAPKTAPAPTPSPMLNTKANGSVNVYDAMRQKGWKTNADGSWTSPRGQTFTSQQIGNRVGQFNKGFRPKNVSTNNLPPVQQASQQDVREIARRLSAAGIGPTPAATASVTANPQIPSPATARSPTPNRPRTTPPAAPAAPATGQPRMTTSTAQPPLPNQPAQQNMEPPQGPLMPINPRQIRERVATVNGQGVFRDPETNRTYYANGTELKDYATPGAPAPDQGLLVMQGGKQYRYQNGRMTPVAGNKGYSDVGGTRFYNNGASQVSPGTSYGVDGHRYGMVSKFRNGLRQQYK